MKTLHGAVLALGALALTASIALSGCGSEDDTAAAAEDADKDHVFKGQKRALDSARGVAEQLQDAAQRQKDAVKESQ